jgi:hypothetical protein
VSRVDLHLSWGVSGRSVLKVPHSRPALPQSLRHQSQRLSSIVSLQVILGLNQLVVLVDSGVAATLIVDVELDVGVRDTVLVGVLDVLSGTPRRLRNFCSSSTALSLWVSGSS